MDSGSWLMILNLSILKKQPTPQRFCELEDRKTFHLKTSSHTHSLRYNRKLRPGPQAPEVLLTPQGEQQILDVSSVRW